MTNAPIAYTPAYETQEPDEAETIKGLMDTMLKVRETTYADTGHAMRSVHVKSHGLLKGELRVLDNLPPSLAQGLFAEAGTYSVVMRLSTTPGDILPDQVSTPRGCAFKIVGVEGERLPGSENDMTQDFVMVNGDPAFQVANLKRFLANLKLLAATTDKGEGAKRVVSAVMQTAEKAVETFGGTSSKLKNMGGEPENHLLGETYFTQVPLLYGQYMAKFCLAPVTPELKALKGQPLDIGDDAFGIRKKVVDFFRQHGGEWELRAQLCTDIDKMPLEDASVIWPEELSHYIAVAKLTVPPQLAWSETRSAAMDDGMSFSPWHGLAAHRPLGSVMRGRKAAYEASAKFRAFRNKVPMAEPTTLDGLA